MIKYSQTVFEIVDPKNARRVTRAAGWAQSKQSSRTGRWRDGRGENIPLAAASVTVFLQDLPTENIAVTTRHRTVNTKRA